MVGRLSGPWAGGTDAIMMGIGRDCTALFEAYHPFTDKPKHVLAKYQVDQAQPRCRPFFPPKPTP
jgi:hypothetical protein